jgi:hypothetical protein
MEPIQGQALNEDDVFWLEQGKALAQGNLAALHDAGKQLITMLTTMQGIYLGAIAYSEVAKTVGSVPRWTHLLLAGPLLIWLAALYCALQVFRTQAYDLHLHSPDHIKQTLEQIADRKQRHVQHTYWLIAIGLVWAVLNIVFYFAVLT